MKPEGRELDRQRRNLQHHHDKALCVCMRASSQSGDLSFLAYALRQLPDGWPIPKPVIAFIADVLDGKYKRTSGPKRKVFDFSEDELRRMVDAKKSLLRSTRKGHYDRLRREACRLVAEDLNKLVRANGSNDRYTCSRIELELAKPRRK